MTDLAEFLLARISEDEQAARAVGDAAADPRIARSSWDTKISFSRDCTFTMGNVIAAHVARHLPVRVLADCAAKRAVIALHPEAVDEPLRTGAAWAYDETLRRLALAYVDHPDYREAWKP